MLGALGTLVRAKHCACPRSVGKEELHAGGVERGVISTEGAPALVKGLVSLRPPRLLRVKEEEGRDGEARRRGEASRVLLLLSCAESEMFY